MAYLELHTTDEPARISDGLLKKQRSRPQIRSPNHFNFDSNTLSSRNGVIPSPNKQHGYSAPSSPSGSIIQTHKRPRARTRIFEDDLINALPRPPESNPKYRNQTSSDSEEPYTPRSGVYGHSSIALDMLQPRKSNPSQNNLILINPSLMTSTASVTTDDMRSIDSPPFLVGTADPYKILSLMKTLCGRMRGIVEYQASDKAPLRGLCYIDNVKGSLMCEGSDREPYVVTVITDLRGIQIEPVEVANKSAKWLNLTDIHLRKKVYFRPVDPVEYDLWLAALICWQQVRIQTTSNRLSPSGLENQSGSLKSSSNCNPDGLKASSIIKVAKLLLWDKRTLPSTPPLTKTSSLDLRLPSHFSWRQITCTLHDNGELKLLTEDNSIILSIIQLPKFSRCSIQLVDGSVLNEEFCIGIFPQYTSISTQKLLPRPIYFAFESRLTHEVWFCLLRAFTIPEIYGPRLSNIGDKYDNPPPVPRQPGTESMFRIEKTIILRILEAKIRKPATKAKIPPSGKSPKVETDASIGNYYAEVMIDGEIRARTSTRNDTKTPFWREDFEFRNLPPHSPMLMIILKELRQLADSAQGSLSSTNLVSNSSPEAICWTTEISLDNLDRGKDGETWWPVFDSQQVKIGEMLLGIKYEELVVLPANEYQPISKLLHNFGNGLTIRLSQAIPSSRKILSETMMNIFQVSGYAGDWLTTLIEEEIDGPEKDLSSECRIIWSKGTNSKDSLFSVLTVSDREQSVRDMGRSLQVEANLLFRGNSLLTQALDFHMRRVGKQYLADVLTDRISEINSMNPDCEVDPSRIVNTQDRNKNWSLLFTLTTKVWQSIVSSAARFPPELRKILKYIRAVAEDRYGDFLRTVTYTSVSGLLFLRFLCPAMLNPKLFGLLRDNPQAKAQRTLTLIAKGLQALANFSNFGKKESWMEPMNRFLAIHRKGMKAFIDSICSISSEEHTSSLPASYSTPVIIFSRLPPDQREGFPSLPFLIDHAQNFSKLVKVWLDANNKAMVPDKLDGDLLEFHQLCLKLQHRTHECLNQAERIDYNGTKQPQEKSEGLKITPSRDVPYDSMEHNRSPNVDVLSCSSGNGRAYSQDAIDRVENMETRMTQYDQLTPSFKSSKSLCRMQDSMDLDQNSQSLMKSTHDENPAKSFLGGLRRGRENENRELRYGKVDDNFMSASWSGGFV